MSLAEPTKNGHKVKALNIVINTQRDDLNEGLWQGSKLTFDNQIYVKDTGRIQAPYTYLDFTEILALNEDQHGLSAQDVLDLERIFTKMYNSKYHQIKLGADGHEEWIPAPEPEPLPENL